MKTYDPKKIHTIIGGVEMSGFADGTFLSVQRDEDAFAKITGADGEVARAKSNNRSGMLTLTLLGTSSSNDVLSGFALADETSNNGVVPVIVKDSLGTTTLFAGEGWVKKFPNVDYSKSIEPKAWSIDLASSDFFVGGNP